MGEIGAATGGLGHAAHRVAGGAAMVDEGLAAQGGHHADVSVGRLTQSAPAADIGLDFAPA